MVKKRREPFLYSVNYYHQGLTGLKQRAMPPAIEMMSMAQGFFRSQVIYSEECTWVLLSLYTRTYPSGTVRSGRIGHSKSLSWTSEDLCGAGVFGKEFSTN